MPTSCSRTASGSSARAPRADGSSARGPAGDLPNPASSSPLYNVTYVRVYQTEPEAVWYSYTTGYLSGFLAWGNLPLRNGVELLSATGRQLAGIRLSDLLPPALHLGCRRLLQPD